MGKNQSRAKADFGCIDGTSKKIQNVYKLIARFAALDMPVLITGATGTGKEKCAEAIHTYSPRHEKDFVPFNCAAHTKDMLASALFGHIRDAFTGAFENRLGAITQAQGGTLFLDEIGDMPTEMQASLLRFTQDHNFQKLGSDKIIQANVRLICATNMDLEKQMKLGLFREDLYYRLNAAHIHMPALKERANDLVDIAYSLLEKICSEQEMITPEISQEAMNILLSYDWPGNVREVENVLQWCLSHHKNNIINVGDLPKDLGKHTIHKKQSPSALMKMPLREIERNAIMAVIDQCQGNIVEAAAILDIAPSTIYRKMHEWESR
ncbi:MAG: sigma-54 dependent transcriptional regulator [Pseudomonadota bacterium]